MASAESADSGSASQDTTASKTDSAIVENSLAVSKSTETVFSMHLGSVRNVNEGTKPTIVEELRDSALPENKCWLAADSGSVFGVRSVEDCFSCAPFQPKVLVLEPVSSEAVNSEVGCVAVKWTILEFETKDPESVDFETVNSELGPVHSEPVNVSVQSV